MPRDYEDVFDLGDMSDADLRSLVIEELDAYGSIDAANVHVRVHDGLVTLSGRVGTEEERRIAERVLTDVVGVTRYKNSLVIDPIRRSQEPEAADEHLADEASRDGMLGDFPIPQETREAELASGDDLDADLFGTHDVQKSIAEGDSYNPPDSPTPEGLGEGPEDEGTFGKEEEE
ncbi:MAG TPA: BON domain-containing protein [Gemmatimonadaceae bacterium]|nr:BON domain-containing protein [Gemmatimonadaceae bacterium]